MEEEYIAVRKSDLMEYIYYDESHNLICVLNKSKLKEIMQVNEVILEEKEHK